MTANTLNSLNASAHVILASLPQHQRLYFCLKPLFHVISKCFISSNKSPWHLFNFGALRCGAYWRAKISNSNNKKQLPLRCIVLYIPEPPVNFNFSYVIYLFHIHLNLVEVG